MHMVACLLQRARLRLTATRLARKLREDLQESHILSRPDLLWNFNLILKNNSMATQLEWNHHRYSRMSCIQAARGLQRAHEQDTCSHARLRAWLDGGQRLENLARFVA